MKNMKQKLILRSLIALVLIVSGITTNVNASSSPKDYTNEAIFTQFDVNPKGLINNPSQPIEFNLAFSDMNNGQKVKFKPGDFFDLTLPSNDEVSLRSLRAMGSKMPVLAKDKNGKEITLGELTFNGSHIHFEFMEDVLQLENVTGTINLKSVYDNAYRGEDDKIAELPTNLGLGSLDKQMITISQPGTPTGVEPSPIFYWKTGTFSTEVHGDMNWWLNINSPKEAVQSDVKVIDTIGEGHKLVDGSIMVDVEANGELKHISAEAFNKEYGTITVEGQVLTVMIPKEKAAKTTFTVTYDTRAFDKKLENYKNSSTIEYKDESGNLVTDTPKHYTDTSVVNMFDDATIGGEMKDKGVFRVQKFIKDTDEVLEGVTFEITDKDGKKIEGITNEDGIFDFNLEPGNYTLKEIKTRDGFELDTTEYQIEMTEKSQSKSIYNDYQRVDVVATKKWVGGSSPRPTVTFDLYRSAKGVTERVDGASIELVDGQTTADFGKQLKFDKEGNEYTYSVKETTDLENYIKLENGLEVTNTYNLRDVAVNKVWVGGPAVHPTIQIQLYANDIALENHLETLTSGTNVVTFKNLPIFDEAGKEIVYSAKEVNVPEGYEMEQTDALTITNHFIVEKIDITAHKIWDGGPSVKPTITFGLVRDGIEMGITVDLVNGEETAVFEDLPKTDPNGKDYVYTIKELDVPKGYVAVYSEDGLTVTNYYDKPVIVDPHEPKEPTKPTKPVEPTKPVKPTKPVEQTKPEVLGVRKEQLPQTGVSANNVLLYGSLLLISGIGMFVLKHHREEKE